MRFLYLILILMIPQGAWAEILSDVDFERLCESYAVQTGRFERDIQDYLKGKNSYHSLRVAEFIKRYASRPLPLSITEVEDIVRKTLVLQINNVNQPTTYEISAFFENLKIIELRRKFNDAVPRSEYSHPLLLPQAMLEKINLTETTREDIRSNFTYTNDLVEWEGKKVRIYLTELHPHQSIELDIYNHWKQIGLESSLKFFPIQYENVAKPLYYQRMLEACKNVDDIFLLHEKLVSLEKTYGWPARGSIEKQFRENIFNRIIDLVKNDEKKLTAKQAVKLGKIVDPVEYSRIIEFVADDDLASFFRLSMEKNVGRLGDADFENLISSFLRHNINWSVRNFNHKSEASRKKYLIYKEAIKDIYHYTLPGKEHNPRVVKPFTKYLRNMIKSPSSGRPHQLEDMLFFVKAMALEEIPEDILKMVTHYLFKNLENLEDFNLFVKNIENMKWDARSRFQNVVIKLLEDEPQFFLGRPNAINEIETLKKEFRVSEDLLASLQNRLLQLGNRNVGSQYRHNYAHLEPVEKLTPTQSLKRPSKISCVFDEVKWRLLGK